MSTRMAWFRTGTCACNAVKCMLELGIRCKKARHVQDKMADATEWSVRRSDDGRICEGGTIR
jgi:hypothetical protein